MGYGIQCVNNSGELTISSDAYTFCYLGKATLSSVTHYAGTVDSSAAGYSVWTFNSSGPIIAALGLGASQGCIAGISQSGSTWTITVIDYGAGSEGPAGAGYSYGVPRSDSDVYVFGLPTVGGLPTYGVALYNASGVVTADLSKIGLVPKARASLATGSSTITGLPALTKPAIVGSPSYQRFDSTHSGSFWINEMFLGLWSYSGTTLSRGIVLQSHEKDATSITARTIVFPTNVLLIEANGLT